MASEEVSLSIEETNKLRASLGLKPLSVESSKPAKPPPRKEEVAKAASGRDAEELRNRLAERREARRIADLAATTTLGAPDEEVDDVASWIGKIGKSAAEASKSKTTEQQQRRRQKRGRRSDDAEADSEDEAAGLGDLAGAKVAVDTGDLMEGETLVLTLADQPLLDAKGQLLEEQEDKLENVLQREQSKRDKARRAATKSGQPLWQEDGKVRRLLDKYDEEEEEALGMVIDEEGRLKLEQQRQEEVRRRLAEGAARLESAAVGVGDVSAAAAEPGQQGDFYTAGEMEAMQQPKKKKKKRKLRSKTADEEEGGGGGGLDLDALEAAAAAEGGGDLGSRAHRSSRREQKEAERAAAVATKAARFEAALEKANWASTFLRPEVAAAGGGDEEDVVDAELAESLARVRRMAQGKAASTAGAGGGGSKGEDGGDGGDAGPGPGSSVEALAAQLAKKRQADEVAQAAALKAGAAGGETGVELFTETTEFVRSVAVAGPSGGGGGAGGASSSFMDVDEPAPPEKKPQQQQRRKFRKGGWVVVDEPEGEGAGEDTVMADGEAAPSDQPTAEGGNKESVTAEQTIGRGLAGALALLKGQGALKRKVNWGGRTNDKKPVALIGLDDVYTGGAHEEAVAQRIETALTQRDEFGRIMTPKERFRQLCYDFHGMKPSKNKQEKRQRKYLEEVAVQRATTSTDPSADLGNLRQVQQHLGTAYIPLTGKVKPPGTLEPEDDLDQVPGTASIRKSGMASIPPTPVLGGGTTPLTGKRKVEMMLGISNGGSNMQSGRSSMPPPAPKPSGR